MIAATCESDHAVKSPDGRVKDCAPFRCEAGRCLDTCTDSASCSTGFVCDTATTRCMLSPPVAEADGGCSFSASRFGAGPTLSWALALLAALYVRRRTSGGSRSPT